MQGALSREGPQPGPGHPPTPHPSSSLRLLAHPAGDFQKGLLDCGFDFGHFGCQVWSGHEEACVYFPFSPSLLHESCPRSWDDKSVARIVKNLAIVYRAFPTSKAPRFVLS